MKDRNEQEDYGDVPTKVSRKTGYVRIRAHDKLVNGPVVFAQKIREEKYRHVHEAPPGGLDVLEYAIQKSGYYAEQRYNVFEILKYHPFSS